MTAVLVTERLAVGYRRHTVLEDLDLCLESGRLVCLLGANGSGKSTLLRTIAGMQPALAGTARLDGEDVARLEARARARLLAVVLTEPVDVGLMRAADLVALGRYAYTGWTGRLAADDEEAVAWALRATGAIQLGPRPVAELSDGERQRVLIARALAQRPALLALDEPMAYVDVARRVELTQLLRGVARTSDIAVLITTHDLDLAIRTADELWLIDGNRVHVGAPEDLVLSGAVAGAFASPDVAFDLHRGTFVPTPSALGRIRVIGAGPAAVWAARAMEREGLAVVGERDHAELEVVVRAADHWQLCSSTTTSDHCTIGALVAAVRSRLAGPGARHLAREMEAIEGGQRPALP